MQKEQMQQKKVRRDFEETFRKPWRGDWGKNYRIAERMWLGEIGDEKSVEKRDDEALECAASENDYEAILWLLQAGTKVRDDAKLDLIGSLVVNSGAAPSSPEDLYKTYKIIQVLLKNGCHINAKDNCYVGSEMISKSALETYNENIRRRGPIHMLLLAAGDAVDDASKEKILRGYLKRRDQDKLSLKHLSRETVRNQMIKAHPHDNLFLAVPKLGIPSELQSYLLYHMSLDDKNNEKFLRKKFWMKYVPDDDEWM